MKFMPGTPRDVMDRELARWRARSEAKINGGKTNPPGSREPRKFPNRDPEYGSAIGRGGMTTMQFMDSDGDNVDDRFQRGPGQPRESGQPGGSNNPVINKSPGKPIINREVSKSRDSSVMKFAPGTPPEVMQAALTKAGYPDKVSGAGNTPKKPSVAADSPATPVPAQPPRRGGGGRRGLRAGRREGRRQAGMNFGLMPTEVIEQTRGRGYGLTYQPQQRTGKQIKFGGGGPQNVINFNPIMSQQANPNIRIGVGGSKQVSRPTQTSSPIQESGPGSVYTGPNQGNFEEGPGNQTNPIYQPIQQPIQQPIEEPIDRTPDTKPEEPKKPKNKYRRLMDRYMRRFDRTAYGAGSKRGTDRFSAKDIRMMTKAGRKFGGSKKQVARDVLDYARDYRGKTKMGTTAKRQLDKLQDMLGSRRKAEKKAKSKAAKKQRQRRKKQSRKKSRARAKAKARSFKRSRRGGGGKRSKRGGKKRGGKRGRRR